MKDDWLHGIFAELMILKPLLVFSLNGVERLCLLYFLHVWLFMLLAMGKENSSECLRSRQYWFHWWGLICVYKAVTTRNSANGQGHNTQSLDLTRIYVLKKMQITNNACVFLWADAIICICFNVYLLVGKLITWLR